MIYGFKIEIPTLEHAKMSSVKGVSETINYSPALLFGFILVNWTIRYCEITR